MTEKDKGLTVKQAIGKIFNNPNILKILPILLIPTIIVCIINIIIVVYIMPGEIKDIVGLNNYGSVIIAVVIMILVRLIYKNSLYFKISLSLVLLVAVAIVMTRVNSLLGDATKAKEKLGWVAKTSLKELISEMVENDFNDAKKEALLKSLGY